MTAMMPTQPPALRPGALGGEVDFESLDALVSSSRRLGRFWPPLAAGPQPAAARPAGVSVPSGAQQLVAAMADYGS
ncbi:hypothetical protein [Kitasatospora sp. DSM 101779]|uniref:hypothetical protein n=1 Tax=Kitasatospora sp. DSM 101779 TaxID=2853165 RepID=UPI0021D82C77|nr:hypothetical protein [Kitasatospora sp. DSM 101779]MCU7825190.1 hypothetical protein [Kitasatospora sp. DSM 101779]